MAAFKFRRTWKQAQQQATVAIKQYAQTDNREEQRRLLALAQELVNEAVKLDDRPTPEPWRGDGNH